MKTLISCIAFIILYTLTASLAHAQDGANQDQGETETMRLLNWNIYNMFDDKKLMEPGAAWIKAQHPDIVTLQEVRYLKQGEFNAYAKKWGHDYAVMLKETGYPVAITSNAPIEVITKRVEGFHHGYLHCKTHGVHFFIVHFWPSLFEEGRIVLAEARKVRDDGEPVVILGDFNAMSRFDEAYLAAKPGFSKDAKGEKKLDFTMTNLFYNDGWKDLVRRFHPEQKFSFGTPVLIPKWKPDMAGVEAVRSRIDFIFADPKLNAAARDAKIIINDQTDHLADHYPLRVDFNFPAESPSVEK